MPIKLNTSSKLKTGATGNETLKRIRVWYPYRQNSQQYSSKTKGRLAMIIINQIRNKMKTHGPALTFWYCISFAAKTIFNPVKRVLFHSYSQTKEDITLEKLIGRKKNGFYVDIGAHHPVKLSNTNRFYQQGWHGINIEPNPQWIKLFETERPRDKNICCGVGENRGSLTYYEMSNPGLSGFDKTQIEISKKLGSSVKKEYQVPIRSLSEIFMEHVQDSYIDFLSIDIEGMEYEALNSNDWSKWRPRFICIECASDENVRDEPVLKERDDYFKSLKYKRVSELKYFGRVLNAIYADTLTA